jgi:hypothetical protein
VNGDIEQQHRTGSGAAAQQTGGGVQQFGTIGCRHVGERCVKSPKQIGEISTGGNRCVHQIACNPGQSEFLERACQGAREAWRRGDWREVGERRIAHRREHRASGNRFGAKGRARRLPVRREGQDGCPRRKLRQTEPGNADRGAAAKRNPTREVVCGAACRGDDRNRMIAGKLMEKCGGRFKSRG